MRFVIFSLAFLYCSAVIGQNNYKIIDQQTQDSKVFTQGLVVDESNLYLSSGLYGKSFLKRVSEQDELSVPLGKRLFAEGITIVDDRLYMLTWRAGKLLVFDKPSLELIGTHSYDGEGWGLTHNASHFFMSSGSHYLQIRRKDDFQLDKYLRVTDQGKPLTKINELEYRDGQVWANVWFSNSIYRIDPETGHVTGQWDMSELVESLELKDPQAVLNGIAYDEKREAFWVTGKLWPKRYLVRFEEDASDK